MFHVPSRLQAANSQAEYLHESRPLDFKKIEQQTGKPFATQVLYITNKTNTFFSKSFTFMRLEGESGI